MAGPLGGLLPGLTRSPTTLKYLFTGAIVVMYASYLLALKYVPLLRARWAIGAVLAVHAFFFLAPPLALTDVFNYVNYGRMEVVHHLNPYTTIPILEPHSDPSYYLSQLAPAAEPVRPAVHAADVRAGPARRGRLVLGDQGDPRAPSASATILLVWKCARLLGRDPVAAIVLVGLNPIVLVWGLGGDHNDFLMVFFIMLGFYLLLRSARGWREISSAAADPHVGQSEDRAGVAARKRARLAVAARAAGDRRGRGVRDRGGDQGLGGDPDPGRAGGAAARAAAGRAGRCSGWSLAGVAVAAASLIAFGLHIPDLSTQSRLVTSESVPNLLGLALGAGGETEGLRTVLSGVLILVVACVACSPGGGGTRSRPAAG